MSLSRNLVFLGLLSLTGCSNTASVTSETIKYAVLGADDVTVSAEHVNKLPYASAYLKIGDNPRIFVVLAYVNGDELSWLTADRVMIITRHGRVIKTVGMENDLVMSESASADPVSMAATSSANWSTLSEWEQRYLSGYRLEGTMVRAGQDELDLVTRRVSATRFEETVSMFPGGKSWTNVFWRDPVNGQVVKTQQHLGPDLPVIELTILKPFSS
uniref:YjbF family lipoprotein n=1 Tax=Aeromonas hydrophila TaxID=644 RepID=A0A346ACI8_AERHY|nr:YjbF family lipoprotein [Aeromonas hydrophila]